MRRAQTLSKEYEELQSTLSDAFDIKTARKAGGLERIKQALENYEGAKKELAELEVMLKDNDADIREMAESELESTQKALGLAARTLTEALVKPHPYAHLPAIVEIRPGTGGGEAYLFTAELTKMYTNYAKLQNWPTTIINIDTSVEAGESAVTEAIFSIDFPGAYDILRHEAGVHRVQRVPATEQKGRVHTSASTVIVLPLFPTTEVAAGEEDPDSKIETKDVKTEVMRARGAGGQHVNTTDSAVRLTHIPTGIVAAVQETRSQHKNREKAWTVLRARVAEKRRREREEAELAERRRLMGGKVGSGGDRSDKVRTYNFNQSRVTDHRAQKTVHSVEAVMSGEGLGELLEAVAKWRMEMDVEMMEWEVLAQEEKKKEVK